MAEQENHRKKDALVKCEDRPSRIFAPSRTAVKDAPLWTNFWETGGVRKDEKEATGRGRGEKKEGKVNRRRRCGSLRYKLDHGNKGRGISWTLTANYTTPTTTPTLQS
ncbi:uncharacterized protein LOC143213300 isoform X2 [Lasioglossum baleicum]|uniref:uncharacterized protein LOC143213300 isoform X2 n=1 Tax=Lasioglossum baleicum TaxID=434251 RepID=UPI003FCE9558